jgi:hypothetical protein
MSIDTENIKDIDLDRAFRDVAERLILLGESTDDLKDIIDEIEIENS